MSKWLYFLAAAFSSLLAMDNKGEVIPLPVLYYIVASVAREEARIVTVPVPKKKKKKPLQLYIGFR